MRVEGYDREREAWRVAVAGPDGELRGWVPEALVAEDRRRPPHEDVYRWLDRHQSEIERALIARQRGTTPQAPYDRLSLGED